MYRRSIKIIKAYLVGTINGLNLLVEEKGEYSFRHFDVFNSVGEPRFVAD